MISNIASWISIGSYLFNIHSPFYLLVLIRPPHLVVEPLEVQTRNYFLDKCFRDLDFVQDRVAPPEIGLIPVEG